MPKGFFPQQDTSRLNGTIMADQDTSFQTMNRLLNQFAATVGKDEDVVNVIAFTGGGGRRRRTGDQRRPDVRRPQGRRPAVARPCVKPSLRIL